MSVNRGKQFEDAVSKGISDTGSYVLRLYDPQGGYLSVANPCDFVVWNNHQMFMFECKSTHENTLSIYSNDPKRKYGKISNTQWEGMLEASKHGVVAGVVCWWIDKDVTKFIPIQRLQELREQGNKSVRYDIEGVYLIGGRKKRVLFDYDFQPFFEKFY